MLRTSLAPLLRRALVGIQSSSSSSVDATAAAAAAAAGRAGRALFASSSAPAAAAPKIEAATPAERAIADLILANLDPGVERVAVKDTSGGCGSMYTIEVASSAFEGKPVVRQHQAVARALGDEVGKWHGFQLVTTASKAS
jgi:BolA-like protein 3